jgi:uncharacterized membrane-anchored protein
MEDRMHHSTTRSTAAAAALALGVLAFFVAPPTLAKENGYVEEEPVGFDWQFGPAVAELGDGLADIEIPDGYMALGREETQRLMEYLQNPVNGTEVGTIAPADDEAQWFIVFEWEEIGYVPDDDQDEIDAESLLASIREGNEAANEERAKRGWTTMEIVGWQEEPHYDEASQNLTWAVLGRTGEYDNVNRIMKLLGRRGVMTATLVSDLHILPVAAVETDQLLANFRFRPGNTYAEYIPGKDKLAEIGLAALIVGGAGAALIQTGLLARFWKVIVAGLAAIGGGIARFFGRGKSEQYPGNTA